MGSRFYPIDETYFDNASGYGVHIGNHSYSMIVNPGNKLEKFVPPVDSDTISEIEWEISDCILCRESFLFSFQNGVINVVSAGNGNSQYATSRYRSTRSFPQSFDDSWTFLTGASAYDGNTILDSINASSTEPTFFSYFNENLDFIAPGSDSIVVTTKSGFTEPLGANYRKFNGTSASAPHVSGAAALLLSHYNQNCYSPSNLTIEDVEYVLEKSATDVMEPGFDEASGYGRINVKKAIDMIDYPEFQIWHPELDFVSETIEVDTININVNRPIPTLYIGPLSSSFLLEQETDYKVVRYKIRRTESFQNIIPITTEIIDVWPVLSQTNCLNKFIDTSFFSTGNPAAPFDLIIDTFRVEPNFKIVDFDVVNNLIIYEGYTYNFILEYELGFEFEVGNNVNIWYPFDVNLDTANFSSSFYIKDSTLTDLVVSPCDSLNLLYDEYLGLEELSIPNDILIYPNPSNLNNVNIKSKNILTSQINVFDLNGSIVIQKKISDGQLFNLDISMLKTGCYWIETTSLNNITNRHKMIKI